MVSFEIFVKAMPPSLSELKVLPSFCFAFKIPDNVAASSKYLLYPFTQQKSAEEEKVDYFMNLHMAYCVTYFIMVMGYFYDFSGFSDLSKICLRLPITQVIRL